jgi:O-antigen/teichoic acid export membrane protein
VRERASAVLPPPESGAGGVARRALHGALALGVRQLLVQGLNIAGGILLARLLAPGEFGFYAVVTFLLTFLIAFGDVGLAASLVRQEEEPSTGDYRALFTAQQLLVVAVVALFWAAAPAITGAYGRSAGDAWLLRLVGLSLVVTSLQTIPSVRLERHLAFDRLAVVEVAQSFVFNVTAVTLAWRSHEGALSIAVALFARSLVGAALINLISPWPIGWRWDWRTVRAHLRFGVPYQGISFVSLLKDSITPVLIGLLLGAAEVGYVNWAGMVAAYPVLALMVLQRVYMPAFARMSAHPDALGGFIERVLRATHTVAAPLAVLTLVLIEPITTIIFGAKWLPALPYFYLLWAANLFVPTATPLMGLLNALGRPGLVFRFALLWMIGTWLLGAPLVVALGAIGFAIANVAVQLSNLLLFRAAQAAVPFRIARPMLPAWGAAAIAGAVVFALARAHPPHTVTALVAYAVAGLVVYQFGLLGLDVEGARRAWTWIRSEEWVRGSR